MDYERIDSPTVVTPKLTKPILKWAGGKTQLLSHLLPKVPRYYKKYIEPFVGGGALFFALKPKDAIIGDSNPELINVYQVVRDEVDSLILHLQQYHADKETFYSLRNKDWQSLSPVEAAARTMFLNRTCYNGLYRVNRQGHFNVPFGRYATINLCDVDGLRAASETLQHAQIIHGDYKTIVRQYADDRDFIYFDPPYIPISPFSDFKRYTKEQFYEADHRELAAEIEKLHNKGCYILVTNSNHPLVHELFSKFRIEIVKSRRNINARGNLRTGEDVIVTIPSRQVLLQTIPRPIPEQAKKYPSTRFMGSKEKIIPKILNVTRNFTFESVLDLFSGSGVVAYAFKACGYRVIANDYMSMAATFAKALVENNNVKLLDTDISRLLSPNPKNDHFVSQTFQGLYFTDEENEWIDNIRANIKNLDDQYKQALAMAALIRSCLKKRPRGVFTYTGHRYDDGRNDLKLSLEEHFQQAVMAFNAAVYDNARNNIASRNDALATTWEPDLVYMDPPYYSPLSDNEYVRRYHFVEGLACDWAGLEIQWHTVTRKFRSYPTPFSSRNGAYEAFNRLFQQYQKSILVVSYSSNSLPTKEEMLSLLAKYKQTVDVLAIDYRYSFGTHAHKIHDNKNDVQEYLFVGY